MVTRPETSDTITEFRMKPRMLAASKAAGQLASVGIVGQKRPLSTSSFVLKETAMR
ncbi:hypothetical protein D3C87_2061600 [compost metagenome]